MNKPWVRQDTVLIPTAAFAFGFTSGLVSSSKLASRQFLAENAHRLPTTVQGWYFYQKTKNYRVLFSALKGGLVTGTRLATWTSLFVLSQEAVERFVRTGLMHSGKGDEDTRGVKALAGGTAGVGLAAVAGSFYRLSKYTRGRRLMLGLGMGLLAGGTVDLRDWMRDKLDQERGEDQEVKMV
ncbi:uncharacterized protein JCM6883_007019 [Sporobolomyces salmoneus]|uniref:uncharacterized protein n=1 Tax=Sporobolomyces salmoneus TaxID=183962 RepID=UPI00316F8AA7